jgi:hypothetical protein
MNLENILQMCEILSILGTWRTCGARLSLTLFPMHSQGISPFTAVLLKTPMGARSIRISKEKKLQVTPHILASGFEYLVHVKQVLQHAGV